MTNHVPSRARPRTLLRCASISFALVAIGACAPQGGGPGVLGKPQDGIPGPPEAHRGDFATYVQQIDFGLGSAPGGIFEGPLKCGDPAKCGGKANVNIRIVPSNYALTNNWERALGNANGYVAAKVMNVDDVTFDRFNLGPGDIAYVWVGALGGAARNVALYKLEGDNARRIFTFPSHKFCRTATPAAPAVHIYVPASCQESSVSPLPAKVQQASLDPFGALKILVNAFVAKIAPPPALDGLWISCSLGCCEAQY